MKQHWGLIMLTSMVMNTEIDIREAIQKAVPQTVVIFIVAATGMAVFLLLFKEQKEYRMELYTDKKELRVAEVAEPLLIVPLLDQALEDEVLFLFFQ